MFTPKMIKIQQYLRSAHAYDTVTDQDVKFVSKSRIFKVSYGMQIKQKINQDNDEKH